MCEKTPSWKFTLPNVCFGNETRRLFFSSFTCRCDETRAPRTALCGGEIYLEKTNETTSNNNHATVTNMNDECALCEICVRNKRLAEYCLASAALFCCQNRSSQFVSNTLTHNIRRCEFNFFKRCSFSIEQFPDRCHTLTKKKIIMVLSFSCCEVYTK